MRRLLALFSAICIAAGFGLVAFGGPAHADAPMPIYRCLDNNSADVYTVSSPTVCYKQGGDYVWVYSTWDTKLHGKIDLGKVRINAARCGSLTCYDNNCTQQFFCSAILGGLIYDGVKLLWNFFVAAGEAGV